ncbi:MAG: hypothetical protein IT200_07060 [Thermoleophilia bacterium]|nr:hypothetical protein [Thermoleophilia bacterium]
MSPARHTAAAAAAVLLGAAAPAVGGSVTAALDPAYAEGTTGANGWYRVPVTATYTCTPALLEVVAECPPQEVLPDGTGTDATGATVPVTRTARFTGLASVDDTATVTLESAPGVPLRIDAAPPPPPVITRPADGAAVRPGESVAAAYACSFAGDRSGPAPAGACSGTVPAGDPVPSGTTDPATWGPRPFTVTAADAAGNRTAVTVTYRIEPEPVLPPPAPAGPVATPPAPVAPAGRPATPRVRNARVLRPRPGAPLPRRGVLRWRRSGAAALYNVQVFRISGTRYVKVLSAFPRGSSLRMPARRLVPGQRYVWRVWPYLGERRRYSAAPMGISWFRAVR